MNCRQAKSLFGAAVLNDLDDTAHAELERHLAECARCGAEFRFLRVAGGGGPLPVVPSGLAARLAAVGRVELAAESRRPPAVGKRRRPFWTRAATAAAALFAFALWLPFAANSPPAGHVHKECSCWRFVDGDAGNSRRIESVAFGAPEQVLWEQRIRGMNGGYKPLAWRNLLLVGYDGKKSKLTGGGGVVAFDAADGKVRWRREFDSGDFYKAKGFPDRCLSHGRLYLTDGSGCLVLDAGTGKTLARYAPPLGVNGWSYLTVAGRRLYGASRDGKAVFCAAADTGKMLWQRKTVSYGGKVFMPALYGGRFFLHTSGGAVLALNAADGTEIWHKNGILPRRRAGVYVRGERVLVLASTDELVALNFSDGRPVWRRRVPGAFASGPALGGEAVYLASGRVALSARDGRVLWERLEAVKSPCSSPTVVGDHILTTTGFTRGVVNVFDGRGRLLGTLDKTLNHACEGVIVTGGRAFTVGGGRLLAVALGVKG